jgi:hypothetical protein
VSKSNEPDWFLREWAAYRGKRQADMARDLNWSKNKANIVWHSQQDYKRGVVNELARWLEIEPFELLLRPDEAMALRQMRESAMQIAKGPAIGTSKRTGTEG